MKKTCYDCGTPITKEWCEGFPEVCEHWTPKKLKTNADRIRAMSDRKLAEFLSAKFADIQAQQLSTHTATQLRVLAHTWYCLWMEWLQQPAEE